MQWFTFKLLWKFKDSHKKLNMAEVISRVQRPTSWEKVKTTHTVPASHIVPAPIAVLNIHICRNATCISSNNQLINTQPAVFRVWYSKWRQLIALHGGRRGENTTWDSLLPVGIDSVSMFLSISAIASLYSVTQCGLFTVLFILPYLIGEIYLSKLLWWGNEEKCRF